MSNTDKLISILNILIFIGLLLLAVFAPALIALATNTLTMMILILFPLIIILIGAFNIVKYLKLRNRKLEEFGLGSKILLLFPVVNIMLVVLGILLVVVTRIS